MQEQWSRLGRAVGNIFYPILQAVLPYVNAILMVLVEIANVVAGLLGFKMPEFDYSGLASASDSTSDLIDGMDEASASAEKLKTGLRGFDKLNNISTSSGDSSALSGVDPAIMDAFNDSFSSYNDMMDEAMMKANKIRDIILDWLGFTDGTYTNLKLIGVVLGLILGYKIYKLVKSFSNFKNVLGNIVGTKGASSGAGAIGLLGILGILSVLAFGVWTIDMTIKMSDAIKDSLEATGKTTEQLIKNSADARRELFNLAKQGDTTSDTFKSYDNYLLANIKTTKGQIASIKEQLKSENLLKSQRDALNTQLDTLNEKNENTVEIMKALYDAGYITKDMLGKYATAVYGSRWEEELLNNELDKSKTKAKDFSEELKKSKTSVDDNKIALYGANGELVNLTNNSDKSKTNVQKLADGIGFLSDKSSVGKSKMQEIIEKMQGIDSSSDRAKDKVNKVQEAINNMNGKYVKIEIDANTQMLEKKLKNSITSAFGGEFSFGTNSGGGFRYASGGLPPVGQMFVANENGPELVGQIGGKSFVANQNQMMDLLDRKIGSSSNGMQNATFIIQVGSEEIGKVVLKDLNKMAKNNGEPIVIGG